MKEEGDTAMTLTQPHAHELIPTRHSLITRLKDWEDQDSWKQFFDTYSQLILRVARKAGLTEAEAHEVVQETVITVSKSIKTFRTGSEHGSFKGWLLNTTRWRIMDQFRKRTPDQKMRAGGAATGEPDERNTQTIERLPDPEGSGFERAWDKEWEQHRIDTALARLKTKVRAKHFQIFQLLVARQMPADEVAKFLGVSRALVYVTKHRLSKTFQEELKRMDGEEA